MIKSSEIRFADGKTEVVVQWSKFDGDDCFNDHKLILDRNVLEFGGCHVAGYRKWIKFVDGEVNTIESSFRNPDIMTYSVSRIGGDIRIVVRRFGSETVATLAKPDIAADRQFMLEHWGLA